MSYYLAHERLAMLKAMTKDERQQLRIDGLAEWVDFMLRGGEIHENDIPLIAAYLDRVRGSASIQDALESVIEAARYILRTHEGVPSYRFLLTAYRTVKV